MLLLALDPSSTACGWALFRDKRLMDYGTVRRRKGEAVVDYATGVRLAIKPLCASGAARAVYEINDSAFIPRKRQKSMRLCQEATGRILQALGVEAEPMQADSRKKPQRRNEMLLIYEIKERISEHAIDAIALGHRAVSEIKGE